MGHWVLYAQEVYGHPRGGHSVSYILCTLYRKCIGTLGGHSGSYIIYDVQEVYGQLTGVIGGILYSTYNI